jgi:hypothetical protein
LKNTKNAFQNKIARLNIVFSTRGVKTAAITRYQIESYFIWFNWPLRIYVNSMNSTVQCAASCWVDKVRTVSGNGLTETGQATMLCIAKFKINGGGGGQGRVTKGAIRGALC